MKISRINCYLLVSSLNQPNLSSCATWSSSVITFVDKSWVGQYPIGIFINEQNTVYVTNRDNGSILVWDDGFD
jgi:DNA-binding beta-propeller fold protein YncE